MVNWVVYRIMLQSTYVSTFLENISLSPVMNEFVYIVIP